MGVISALVGVPGLGLLCGVGVPPLGAGVCVFGVSPSGLMYFFSHWNE